MAKRVFTKVFSGVIVCVALPAESGANAIESWLAQEDVEVIGAEVSLVCTTPSQNDGFTFAGVELSQVGIYAQDGAILVGTAQEGWNSVPAGIAFANCNLVAMFPQGQAVPIKEEGYLYINWVGVGKTAGESRYSYRVIAYYTKKGSR